MSDHLRPTAPIAADVLVPSDPAVALALAQRLLAKPLMANHSFGLWGYSGTTPDGHELTIQASGIGGPSAAAVLTELAAHGARRAIRVGTAIALDRRRPGAGALVGSVLARDGAATSLAASDPAPDPALTEALERAAGGLATPATVVSADLVHDPAAAANRERWRREGASVLDLETAAAIAAGAAAGIRVAAVLAIARSATGDVDPAATERRLLELGEVAAAALAGAQALSSGAATAL